MRIAALSSVLLLCACGDFGTFSADPDYCGENDGDAYCGRVSPDKPYCVVGTQSCFDAAGIDVNDPYGCVAAMPAAECRTECGIDGGDECAVSSETLSGSSSSTGEDTEGPATSTTAEPETDTEGPSSTTGPGCSESIPCVDAERPFCIEGECSTCDVAAEPDAACSEFDAATSLCVDATCVQCTAEDASACGGTTPLCDETSNRCVGCEFHEQCEDLGLHACNIATGACFSADAANVTMVSVATPGAVATAVANVEDGAEHTIVLTASAGDNAIVVDGGKTIAIVSDGTTDRVVQGSTGSPTVTVTGADSTVYLHRLELTLNGDDVGISVESSGTLYADSTRISQNSGGGIELAAGTSGFLRNCMIGRNGDEFASTTGITSAGELNVLYSSIVANDGDGADSLQCSSGSVVVRNSIFVGSDANSIDCGVLEASNSAFDEAVAGNDNVGALDPGWFDGVASANFNLSAAGQTEFADIAIWEDGDPPFDFDGELRPNTNGASDHAGADTVP
ncbi:MAG: right-handed parallel beta-helix repeat-containing protein [Nannocystales bacterium]